MQPTFDLELKETQPSVREFINPEIDKSGWGPGPWMNEPDKIHWIDPDTDLDVLMVRHQEAGHWCGYVGVTEGHPFFGRNYSECSATPPCGDTYCQHSSESLMSVHGGITYSRFCNDEAENPASAICHVPFPGRPDRVWWLGFDLAHHMDLSPARAMRDRKRYEEAVARGNRRDAEIWDPSIDQGNTYRDRAYVEVEARELAKQLRDVAR